MGATNAMRAAKEKSRIWDARRGLIGGCAVYI